MRLSTLLLVSSFLARPVVAQVGSVLREARLPEPVSPFDTAFGSSLSSLGDLDGDGFQDLAVGAPIDRDGGGPFHFSKGAVWILFLDGDGAVARMAKISELSGGFTGTLTFGCQFGANLSAIGDLDGDGRQELVVSANDPARLYLLFLNADGSVRAQRELFHTDPVFGGEMDAERDFIGCVAPFYDVDHDGVPDFLWGSGVDDVGAENTGALWIVRMNSDGTLKAASRIASGQGGFTASLEADALFGVSARRIGDVDGDGVEDLGVIDGAGDTAPGGRLWVLFLDADAHVLGQRATTAAEIDMRWNSGPGVLNVSSIGRLEAVSDLDGDGVRELALGADFYLRKGGVALVFLARDGSMRKRLAIGNGTAGLAEDADRNDLGESFQFLGDVDGDGVDDLAVGDVARARGDLGWVSVLALAPDAIRNGLGLNPLTLSEHAEPALGSAWKLELDCGGHAPDLAFLLASDGPRAGFVVPAGELLVDPRRRIFLVVRPHGGGVLQQLVPVPSDLALVNRLVHVQGACAGAPGAQLSNAVYALIGR